VRGLFCLAGVVRGACVCAQRGAARWCDCGINGDGRMWLEEQVVCWIVERERGIKARWSWLKWWSTALPCSICLELDSLVARYSVSVEIKRDQFVRNDVLLQRQRP
jgi:hypothetical protein